MLKRKKTEDLSNTEEMTHLLRRASALAERKNVEGLKDLIRTIWRRLQSRQMLEPYLVDDHQATGCIDLVIGSFGELHSCYAGRVDTYISLSEPIITFPWHPERIIRNLGSIGPDRLMGNFKPSTNHSVNYYWPIMLGQVTGGNHSIAQGIIMGEGEVKVEDWYNLAPLLNKYRNNGHAWICQERNEIVKYCDCPELGMAWEVSRFLADMINPPFTQIDKAAQ
ncbi:DUF6710 family protein [Vibrio rotiferianus]|uniref:DUF6710 family protein n=1 Tax=Vibrio rotiferianus TaxID=190895 RepID=UPI000B59FEB0|nr:DUF6710 family protein [Vibrio rotiferianus]ASI93588.1 hypothetical protein BSZ04_00750 [Vibrio rotiferianus]